MARQGLLANLNWVAQLPAKLRLLAWNSLFKSKFTYALFTLAQYDSNLTDMFGQFLYRSFLKLLQIKGTQS